MSKIHATAIIDPSTELGEDVEIGAYTVIGPNCTLGARTVLGPHVVIEEFTELGEECSVRAGTVLGGPPQDLKFKGERSFVRIGNRTSIREFTTVHRATGEDEDTTIGDDCLIMAYAHIGHNCHVGNKVMLSSYDGLAGHITIEDGVVAGGMVGIHQFVHVGKFAMLGAYSKLVQDVPPFMLADGRPAEIVEINVQGLKRAGIGPSTRSSLRQAYKLLYRNKLNKTQALEAIEDQIEPNPELDKLIAFIKRMSEGSLGGRTTAPGNSVQIAIIAAEASGDRVGGQLAREILRLAPETTLWGTGGKHLRDAGVEVVEETSGFGVVGVASALGLLPKFVATRRRLLKTLLRRRPDVIVAIDAGAVHLGFGPWEGILPWARKSLPDTKLLYYFPPGSWRRTLTRTSLGPITDVVASPFEWNASELNRLGVHAEWVGHPLLDLVKPQHPPAAFAERIGLDLGRPVIGILPGSRLQEIKHILPIQLRAASLIHQRVPGVQFVLALAPTVDRDEVIRCLERVRHQRVEPSRRVGKSVGLPPLAVPAEGSAEALARRQRDWIERAGGEPGDGNFPLVIVEDAAYDVMGVSDALICTSGTATLEAAILKKPMVIVYKLGPENFVEAGILRKKGLDVIGMPNLLAAKIICPELYQENCTPENISSEIIDFLLNPERLLQMKAELASAVALLGEPGGAARAAALALDLLHGK